MPGAESSGRESGGRESAGPESAGPGAGGAPAPDATARRRACAAMAGAELNRTAPGMAAPIRSAASSYSVQPSTTAPQPDRKSTRLNSSHQIISYAVFCLKKKKKENTTA